MLILLVLTEQRLNCQEVRLGVQLIGKGVSQVWAYVSSGDLFFTVVSTTYDLYTCVVPFLGILILSLPYEKHLVFLLLFVLVMPNTIVYYGIQIHDEYFSTNRSLGRFVMCMHVYNWVCRRSCILWCGVQRLISSSIISPFFTESGFLAVPRAHWVF